MNGEREKAISACIQLVPAGCCGMDTVPKFVQLIKLVQQEVGMGNARVRAPRLELAGAELNEALQGDQACAGEQATVGSFCSSNLLT